MMDEDEDTPLSKKETKATKAELINLIMEGKVQKTTMLLHVKNNVYLEEKEMRHLFVLLMNSMWRTSKR